MRLGIFRLFKMKNHRKNWLKVRLKLECQQLSVKQKNNCI